MKIATAILLTAFSLQPAMGKTHYKNQVIGGRAATMGGAYTAVSDDASGIYYNPAGLAYTQGLSLSGSANLFSLSESTYEQTVGSNNWERSSKNLDPSYFGIVKKEGKWAFGFGYALIDTLKENQNQVFENLNTGAGQMSYYSLILDTQDNHYLFSTSLAYEQSGSSAIGLTLSYSYRKFRQLQSQYIEYADGDVEHAFDSKEIKARGVKPQLGWMWSPKEKWSLGLNVGHEILLAQITEDVRSQEGKVSTTNTFMRQTSLAKDETPWEFMLGIAYFRSPEWLYSFNIDYYLETSNNREDVLNLSLGMEHFINQNNALRFGLFSNRTNVATYNNTNRNLDERVHKYGLSLGHGYYHKASEVTFGVLYARGEGEVQPYTGSTSIRNLNINEFKFILASSYVF